MVTSSSDNFAKIWNISTGQELFTLKGHINVIESLAITKDNRRVVTGSWDATAIIWDINTG